jgi:oligopeptide transport system ATP-binding protein
VTETLLSAEGLVKRYSIVRMDHFTRRIASLQAVDDVSFDLRQGETLGIVGESGCGKSTLARLVTRLEEPSGGRIVFRGEDVSTMSAKRLRRFRQSVQIVFQDPYSSLNPTMTIGSLITEPWRIHATVGRRERRRRADELLESVGLESGYYVRRPGELSGGERQRIGIARALALDPEIIVCDEPASALDVSIQAQILELLQKLQRERKLAYILISHDLSVVRYLAHRVAVMYLGRIVELGPAEDVYERPSHPYTRALLAAARTLHGDSAAVATSLARGDVPDAANPPAGCRFHPRCPMAADICQREDPALRHVAKEHAAACHFAMAVDQQSVHYA